MEFRTKVPIPPQEPRIHHGSRILLLGSCFVENMGRKLEYFQFDTLQNPHGILFHPAAIKGFLQRVVHGKLFSEDDLFYHQERWHCFDAHSSLSGSNRQEVLQHLNSKFRETRDYLENASHVIITLGTAWGYHHLESDRMVANCHKLPQRNFRKELTQVEPDLAGCVALLQAINPDVTIVFTVSPVRHLKDGFVENQHSKARLLTAVHKVISENRNVRYFPSYEIVMDELRDYRFYSDNMLHPNQTAIDYIWKRFTDAYMAPETLHLMAQVEDIQKGLAHRPFNKDSEAHRKFLKNLEKKIAALRAQIPGLEF